jgi:hypothetical protein
VKVDVKASNPTWSKWLPCWPTSPHWYDESRFRRYMAHIANREKTTVREFVSEFRGLFDPMLRRSIAALHPQVHAGKFPVYKDQNGKEHDDKSCPTYERHQIGWTDQAKALFDEYEQEVLDRMDAKYSDVFFIARNAEMAIRIATIRRLGIDGMKPGAKIDLDDMRWAIDIVELCSGELLERAAQAMTPEQLQSYALKQLIIQEVKNGDEIGPNGETGVVPDHVLKRKLQEHGDADTVNKALAQLIDSVTIAHIDDKVGKSNGWWRWCARDA